MLADETLAFLSVSLFQDAEALLSSCSQCGWSWPYGKQKTVLEELSHIAIAVLSLLNEDFLPWVQISQSDLWGDALNQAEVFASACCNA